MLKLHFICCDHILPPPHFINIVCLNSAGPYIFTKILLRMNEAHINL